MVRRGEVIDYLVEKYGEDKVGQIVTFGTMKSKLVVKDVGRALDIPIPEVNKLTKLIPDELEHAVGIAGAQHFVNSLVVQGNVVNINIQTAALLNMQGFFGGCAAKGRFRKNR